VIGACKKPSFTGLQKNQLYMPAKNPALQACEKPSSTGLRKTQLYMPAKNPALHACEKPSLDRRFEGARL
jgi:hypothetical protein